MAKNSNGIFSYKGKPLTKNGNTIYYGNFTDKYIVMLRINETEKKGDLDVATNVTVELQKTESNINSKDRAVKKSEKTGLYSAIDIGAVWLERALTAE